MKRLLYVFVVAALGALVYVSDPPGLPAEQSATTESVATVASSQSAVARLAEAGMALRRHPAPAAGVIDPAPQPDKLFGK
ncbi:hypothetical protein [Solidesulfovibrio sp.]|uniref:hypothetical protein n=1 Tax=Solidesulfovibrio sp. TaxID=2910990 RepID=UPI002B21446C|nr:hypothetical protein [Solidesulfovibrio sp.]MEA5089364.1 hypothetical protein [Solidesulfovibrio sp.]HML61890.1 hypothetical protein [Solidesulfovibrio sp.]